MAIAVIGVFWRSIVIEPVGLMVFRFDIKIEPADAPGAVFGG